MDIRVDNNEHDQSALAEQQPLLEPEEQHRSAPAAPRKTLKTPAHKVIRKTFKGTATLANLLPTGSVLIFQFCSPVLSHQGRCNTANKVATSALLLFCASSCFLLSFTDSFRDEKGKVRYGFATFRGIRVLDGLATLPPEVAANYRVRFVDVLHGFLSIMVFAAVAMIDQNVVNCFFPVPAAEAKKLLVAVPAGVGVICSLLFLAIPSKRHGVGFPLSRR
ncbi:protein DMP7-like [Malania oleifera]|uniref:protein DMP7-like n=1 Tax=Malania oleifera TaxID=397392 RepID=UPI0025AE4F09|nr:protein DMP7-like [Malania oleifera]